MQFNEEASYRSFRWATKSFHIPWPFWTLVQSARGSRKFQLTNSYLVIPSTRRGSHHTLVRTCTAKLIDLHHISFVSAIYHIQPFLPFKADSHQPPVMDPNYPYQSPGQSQQGYSQQAPTQQAFSQQSYSVASTPVTPAPWQQAQTPWPVQQGYSQQAPTQQAFSQQSHSVVNTPATPGPWQQAQTPQPVQQGYSQQAPIQQAFSQQSYLVANTPAAQYTGGGQVQQAHTPQPVQHGQLQVFSPAPPQWTPMRAVSAPVVGQTSYQNTTTTTKTTTTTRTGHANGQSASYIQQQPYAPPTMGSQQGMTVGI